MKLTAKEKELILQKRKEEDLEKPKFTAKLAHDLYEFNLQNLKCLSNKYGYFSKIQIDELVNSNTPVYTKVLPKGTEFVGFLEVDGIIEWYDNVNYGIEGMPQAWASEHLTDIKRIKPNKNSK